MDIAAVSTAKLSFWAWVEIKPLAYLQVRDQRGSEGFLTLQLADKQAPRDPRETHTHTKR